MIDGRPVRCRVIAPSSKRGDAKLDLPLLLIHGLGCSADAWKPSLRCFAQQGVDQPVFAPDLPGYGRSPGPKQALDMEALADWTGRLMDALEIKRAHVFGHSMGCQVAFALARRHPERVGALVLVGPTSGTRVVPLWRYVAGLLADGFREPLRYNLTLLRMYTQMGVPRYLATAREMMADDPLAHAGEIAAPCLIVRGERDAIVSDEMVHKFVAALPDAQSATIRGTAHAVPFNQPNVFTRMALAFLEPTKFLVAGAERVGEATQTRARSKATAAAVASTK